MNILTEHNVSATPKNAAKLEAHEQNRLLDYLNDWHLVSINNVDKLQRVFVLKDFLSAMDFANGVTTLAEQEDHHPSVLIEWGKVTINWWSHSIKGLHLNDFAMASRTDEIYENL
jgi:4a-hydroxytetrahydrobiopterin dehydratase